MTITGVNDDERDGGQTFKVTFAPVVSADANYVGAGSADLDVRNGDNDFERVAGQPISGSLSCGYNAAGQRIGADDGSNLYVLMTV